MWSKCKHFCCLSSNRGGESTRLVQMTEELLANRSSSRSRRHSSCSCFALSCSRIANACVCRALSSARACPCSANALSAHNARSSAAAGSFACQSKSGLEVATCYTRDLFSSLLPLELIFPSSVIQFKNSWCRVDRLVILYDLKRHEPAC